MNAKVRKKIVILGGGGFGTFANDLCQFANHDPIGILDNHKPKGSTVNGCPVLGPIDLVEDSDLRATCHFVVAIRDFDLKREWAGRIRKSGGRLTSIFHPSVVISPSATIGEGVMINAFSFVYANARVGDLCIIESHCMIGTEVVIEEGCMIAPGAHVNRATKIEEDCFIGSCSVFVPDITVGKRCVIGAGSAVVRDILPNKVAAGVPARVLRENDGNVF